MLKSVTGDTVVLNIVLVQFTRTDLTKYSVEVFKYSMVPLKDITQSYGEKEVKKFIQSVKHYCAVKYHLGRSNTETTNSVILSGLLFLFPLVLQ